MKTFAAAALAATSTALEVQMTASDFYNIADEKAKFDAAIEQLDETWDYAQEHLEIFEGIPIEWRMFVGIWQDDDFLDGSPIEIHENDHKWNIVGAPNTHVWVAPDGAEEVTDVYWDEEGEFCLTAGKMGRWAPKYTFACGTYHMGKLWAEDASDGETEYVFARQD